MSASGVVSAWERISSWMGGLSGAVDAILTPVVRPLADQLDFLTGDSAAVRTTAQRWQDLGVVVTGLADYQRDVVRAVRSDWTGEAADAFAARMSGLSTAIDDLAKELAVTGEFLDDASLEVETAEQLVETIIRELIEMLIITILAALALSWLTAGISAAGGALAAAAEGAIASARIATIVAKVAAALQQFSALLKTSWLLKTATTLLVVKPVVRTVTGVTGDPLGESIDTLGSGTLRILADEFDDQRSGDTGVQTPLRGAVDDIVGPVADFTDPLLDVIDPYLEPVLDGIDLLPEGPFPR